MKALQAVKPGMLQLVDIPKPEISTDTEVLVKVRSAGICGSDVHIAHGTNPYATYPRVLGHEVAGVVESVGSGVTHVKPGDPVVLEPIVYCGDCYPCRNGRPNVCEHLQVRGVHLDGGFAEYFVSDQRYLHKVPMDLDFATASLIEPHTIGAQANWRAGTKTGDIVLVHGAGPIGLIALHNAKMLGATCIVSEISPQRLALAKDLGADYLVDPLKQNLHDELMKITQGRGANVILEATGVPALLEQSVALASAAGRIVAFSFGNQPIALDFAVINRNELTILGTRHQSYQFEPVIAKLDQIRPLAQKLITHQLPLEEYERAFSLFSDKNSGACKVIFSISIKES